MNRLFSLAAVFSFGVLAASCGSKEKAEVQELKPIVKETVEDKIYKDRIDEGMSRTDRDEQMVIALAKEYIAELQNNNIDAALGKLYEYSLGEIIPLTGERRNELKATLSNFPVLGYKIDSFKMLSNTDNELKYSIRFRESADGTDNPSNYISFLLNPVRYNGEWYLTVPAQTEQTFGLEE